MTHRFPLKEIARQAGLGTATVDRALNNRAHVSPQTRARVQTALAELEAQEAMLSARGRRLFFDFVIEAPQRFSREVRRAVETVLPQIGPAVCRARFEAHEVMTDDDCVASLARIKKRGSHGVCLKARNVASIRECVEDLVASGIPVVTFATDIETPARLAYFGLDNAGAGRTAAYLIGQAAGGQAGTILTTSSDAGFSGEGARALAFGRELAKTAPDLRIVAIRGGHGRDRETEQLVSEASAQLGALRAVYSMGGGNHSILRALAKQGLTPSVYVAHDLDADNRTLLAERRISYVLHHDLKEDARQVILAFLAHHRLGPGSGAPAMSPVQILTPENVPG